MLYNLDELGWYQFEQLCQALLRAAHGAELEAWGGSHDTGKDAYAEGTLRYPDGRIEQQGPFIFQVKFVSNANAIGSNPRAALLAAINRESARIAQRLDDGTWDQPKYFTLLTNAPLTATLRKAALASLRHVLPRTTILLHGSADLAAMLDSEPLIRLSYPQILGLRDLIGLLEQVVHSDVIQRSTLSLESAARLARVFVPTNAYLSALNLLAASGFAVLTGPPEMGKTATARMIALARYSMGWEAYECRHPNDLFGVYNRDHAQVFVADDAFGSTEYRPELAAEWAADLEHIINAADYRHSIIWTSRPGPLNEGIRHLHFQGSAETFPQPSQISVNASRLTVPEKAHILYRHAKAAHLTDSARKFVRKHAKSIVSNRHFTPLRIQRFLRDQLPILLQNKTVNEEEAVANAVASGMQAPTSLPLSRRHVDVVMESCNALR